MARDVHANGLICFVFYHYNIPHHHHHLISAARLRFPDQVRISNNVSSTRLSCHFEHLKRNGFNFFYVCSNVIRTHCFENIS